MGGHLFKDRSRADFAFIKTALPAPFNVTLAFVSTSTSTSTLTFNILDAGNRFPVVKPRLHVTFLKKITVRYCYRPQQ